MIDKIKCAIDKMKQVNIYFIQSRKKRGDSVEGNPIGNAYTVTRIKVEVILTNICDLENVLDIVENVKKKHPEIDVQIRVQ